MKHCRLCGAGAVDFVGRRVVVTCVHNGKKLSLCSDCIQNFERERAGTTPVEPPPPGSLYFMRTLPLHMGQRVEGKNEIARANGTTNTQ